jgi:hypothetical protein
MGKRHYGTLQNLYLLQGRYENSLSNLNRSFCLHQSHSEIDSLNLALAQALVITLNLVS